MSPRKNGRSRQARCRSQAAVAVLAGLLAAVPGFAAEPGPRLALVQQIPVGGHALDSFDISAVSADGRLYALADRSNASVDLFDTRKGRLITRVGGFKGLVSAADGKPDRERSGPAGLAFVGDHELWAGDGDSTVKVIDLRRREVVSTISTAGHRRADEMSYDPRDHLLAVANNADTPAFLSLIDTRSLHRVGRIPFDGTHGTPNAVQGVEQSQWSAGLGLFFVSVPQDGDSPETGAVVGIDPRSRKVVRRFDVQDCAPAGLALGSGDDALLGCGDTFGKPPHAVSQTLVVDLRKGGVRQATPEIGGSDEVGVDRAARRYVVAASGDVRPDGSAAPALGVIDASSGRLLARIATAASAHSVAVNPRDHRIYVPIGRASRDSAAGEPSSICPDTGCIAVYALTTGP